MIAPDQVEVLIPSIRPETLWGCVMSLAHQTVAVPTIRVRDNSERGAMSYPEFRFAVDAAATLGIEVKISRGTSERGIAASRAALIKAGESEWAIFSDDDCYWAPGAIEAMLDYGRYDLGWVAPLLLTPNNESGLPDWIAPWDMDAHPQFSFTSKEWADAAIVSEANGGCLLFKRERYDPEWTADWPEGVGWEDRMIVRKLGFGAILYKAVVWHMIAPGGSNPMRRSDDKTAEFVYRAMEVR